MAALRDCSLSTDVNRPKDSLPFSSRGPLLSFSLGRLPAVRELLCSDIHKTVDMLLRLE